MCCNRHLAMMMIIHDQKNCNSTRLSVLRLHVLVFKYEGNLKFDRIKAILGTKTSLRAIVPRRRVSLRVRRLVRKGLPAAAMCFRTITVPIAFLIGRRVASS